VIVAGVPLGRIGRKSDVAGTCIFLASEAGSYINGGAVPKKKVNLTTATIVCDGGSVLNTNSRL
jgi:NAD(P)-dependent dehydrogenase (short-subunit alcohol dehydrogenase family)